MIRGVVAFLMVALFALPSSAHSIGRSSSQWISKGDDSGAYDVAWFISIDDVENFIPAAKTEPDSKKIQAFVQSAWQVENAGGQCTLRAKGLGQGSAEDYILSFGVLCSNGGSISASLSGLIDAYPSHIHLVRQQNLDNEKAEVLLTSNASEFEWSTASSDPAWLTYMKLGALHILEGYDHLAFLLALLLVVRGLGPVFWCVTGFTVGHSLTLALGSTGWISSDPSIVEPLIAFTIALTATEYGLRESRDQARVLLGLVLAFCFLFAADLLLQSMLPYTVWAGLFLVSFALWSFAFRTEKDGYKILPVLTLGFGLIHGFGFVGVLSDIGLPEEDRLLALFSFNVGVEIGQLIFIIGAAVVGKLLLSVPLWRPRLIEGLTCAALVGVGLFWFAQRVYIT
ncbi:hypothetical protein GCM10017044_27320 [Kordiimonas sediminis]|uniref:HupE/UreJ family protein n=1 Tax=Kordiimonas sediminis TaxID=1735581 RepID=A0A919AWZ8_9PROT|nr:HupE/UreJ family protein [Kordiimonas sediminis]GHF30476.1 hypothetical protein GCM10017044_27320 [Kordiimonas sediminis]